MSLAALRDDNASLFEPCQVDLQLQNVRYVGAAVAASLRSTVSLLGINLQAEAWHSIGRSIVLCPFLSIT